jgi:hypothetical protein
MDNDGENEAGLELVVKCTGIIISVDIWLRTGTFILSLLLFLLCTLHVKNIGYHK